MSCIYYRASLGYDLGFGCFPSFSRNALIWVWFAGRESAQIFIYLLLLVVLFGQNLMKVLGNHLDTDASKLTFNICMCEGAYQ